MPGCGSLRRSQAPLIQIRSAYSTAWKNLTFLVESGPSQWTMRVEDTATSHVLYTAHRGAAAAAQVAAAEFGIFQVLGPASGVSPERLAAELNWRKCF